MSLCSFFHSGLQEKRQASILAGLPLGKHWHPSDRVQKDG